MKLDKMYYSIRKNGKLIFSEYLTYKEFHKKLSFYEKNYKKIQYCAFDNEEDFIEDKKKLINFYTDS